MGHTSLNIATFREVFIVIVRPFEKKQAVIGKFRSFSDHIVASDSLTQTAVRQMDRQIDRRAHRTMTLQCACTVGNSFVIANFISFTCVSLDACDSFSGGIC